MKNKERKKKTLFGAILSFLLVISLIIIPIIFILRIPFSDNNLFITVPFLIVIEICVIIIIGLIISLRERIKEINNDEYKESKKY